MVEHLAINLEEHNYPVFIVGVPRSGTTLLRVLFDSHPRFACGPETPWLTRDAHSLKQLYHFMADNKFGYVANFGVSREAMRKSFSQWVDNLFMIYAMKKEKTRWVEKTPYNSLDIPFLAELFPNARFIHIVRDGRDVACSTAILSTEQKKMAPWHTKNLIIDHGHVVPNTLLNAALRWKIWNLKIEDSLEGLNSFLFHYEDLIASPEKELSRILEFVGDRFEPTMLNYFNQEHDYPSWEWGSSDVKKSRGISAHSVERWRSQLDDGDLYKIEEKIGDALIHYGYKLSLIKKPKEDIRSAVYSLEEGALDKLKRIIRSMLKTFIRRAMQ